MKNSMINSGSIVTGFLASACCIGPLVLTFLGIGGAAFAIALEPYRPFFIGITVVFLALGFFFAYRPQQEVECAPDEVCQTPQSRRNQRSMLWIVAIIAIILVTFPYILPYLPL